MTDTIKAEMRRELREAFQERIPALVQAPDASPKAQYIESCMSDRRQPFTLAGCRVRMMGSDYERGTAPGEKQRILYLIDVIRT